MVKKIFTFKGKTVKELQKMSIEEFSELCNSRIKRSLKKSFDKHILKKIAKAKSNEKAKPIRTHSRDLIVIPEMIGVRFAIYKGNSFELLDITEQMLGHYVGEFVFTRKRLQHGKAGIGSTKSSTAITAR
jgi:small subunit ribosomal protein S19